MLRVYNSLKLVRCEIQSKIDAIFAVQYNSVYWLTQWKNILDTPKIFKFVADVAI